jgi:hypothetical protein
MENESESFKWNPQVSTNEYKERKSYFFDLRDIFHIPLYVIPGNAS